MLVYPKNGDNVLKWAREATKEINSNHIQNGIGVKVTRTPNGTNLVVQGGDKVNQEVERTSMPFDGSLLTTNPTSTAAVIKVLKGSLFYEVMGEVAEVPPDSLTGDYWTVSVSLDDGLTIGIACTYSSSSGGIGPTSFRIAVIPNPDGADTAWIGPEGLLYYPLIRIVEDNSGHYGGPHIFSTTITINEESRTFYGVQCHHGDVVFVNDDDYAYVAIVESGGNGRYSVSAADANTEYSGYVYFVELSGAATFPTGSRVVAHSTYTTVLGSGTIASSSSSSSSS